MSFEAALIGAVTACFGVIVSLGGGAFWYLKELVKTTRADCDKREEACNNRVVKLEAKLDDASDIIKKQAESQQAQIGSLQQMVDALLKLNDRKGGEPA